MLQAVMKFLKDERGASAVEYGLIVGLIAVAVAVVLQAVGVNLGNLFSTINSKLTGATGSGS